MGKTTLIWLLLLLNFSLFSQTNLRFGEWESHLPYQRGLSITQSPNKVYFATDFSIMSVDKEDFSLEFMSKVEGLSEVGISDLKYDAASGNILVIYNNQEMDVITEEGVINIQDIKNNTGIILDKNIYDVHFDGAGTAYLSTGFGVVSFDMQSFEFGFTTQMEMAAFATTTQGNFLYAATEDGLYSLDLSKMINFSDFANWKFLGADVGLPMLYELNTVKSHLGNLWLLLNNEIWTQDPEGHFDVAITSEQGENFEFISDEGPELMIGSRFDNNKSLIRYVNEEGIIQQGTLDCANLITDAVRDEKGRVWYADEWRGFRYTEGYDGQCRRVSTKSIFSHSVSEMLVDDGILYATSGGVTDAFNFLANRDGIYILKEGQWTNYNESNTTALKTADLLNVYTIAKDPEDGHLFLGSFYSGLLEADFDENKFTHYDSENSPVIGSPSFPIREKVAGLAFDDNENLWISAHEAEKPLVVLSKEGNWHSYNVITNSTLGQITVDDFGNKWIQVTGGAGGVLVYSDKGEVANPTLHQQRFINSGNSELPTNVVNCIEKDLDGTIWVGTGEGPVIFGCDPFAPADSSNAFTCRGSIEIVFEDSIPARLLQTEDIRAIGIDGGNQKWFGTRNGIFVQSPNGVDKIARFTSENSPLFNDNIIDLEYDPQTGKMFIASDGGIQAFQTMTTGASEVRHQSKVYAYPNPVRPNYEGLIAFKGLARDATIKITDVAGQLVYQSDALGGTATWDGRDYSGREVASGVYLVFSNANELGNNDNPDTAVTKVLIVR
ncbi:type IX secretion system anionic LPS delivery protein PorZ [Portibacter marinus]|uniref:type IX secretion system anionic LPS delivery protein PorZ n=1 Tax=Portibacter marinus TaxID=2898660 RepID=UPI001F1D324C|nr:hypothetical protein [Portibacter marinus]